MSNCNIKTVSLDTILKKKLELADKAVELLPPRVQIVVKVLRRQVLTAFKDSLDHYLKDAMSERSGVGLKKIDLE